MREMALVTRRKKIIVQLSLSFLGPAIIVRTIREKTVAVYVRKERKKKEL